MTIAYIRPLATLASSHFQQDVKLGKGRFSLSKPPYKKFEKVLRHVGTDNTLFTRFDRKDLIGGEIVTDFAHRIGLTTPPATGEVVNESLSSEAVGALYAYNKYAAPWLPRKMTTQMRSKMLKALRGVGSTQFGLAPDLIEAHLESHKDDIVWMEQVCGFDVRGEIKPVPHPIESEEQLLRVASA